MQKFFIKTQKLNLTKAIFDFKDCKLDYIFYIFIVFISTHILLTNLPTDWDSYTYALNSFRGEMSDLYFGRPLTSIIYILITDSYKYFFSEINKESLLYLLRIPSLLAITISTTLFYSILSQVNKNRAINLLLILSLVVSPVVTHSIKNISPDSFLLMILILIGKNIQKVINEKSTIQIVKISMLFTIAFSVKETSILYLPILLIVLLYSTKDFIKITALTFLGISLSVLLSIKSSTSIKPILNSIFNNFTSSNIVIIISTVLLILLLFIFLNFKEKIKRFGLNKLLSLFIFIIILLQYIFFPFMREDQNILSRYSLHSFFLIILLFSYFTRKTKHIKTFKILIILCVVSNTFISFKIFQEDKVRSKSIKNITSFINKNEKSSFFLLENFSTAINFMISGNKQIVDNQILWPKTYDPNYSYKIFFEKILKSNYNLYILDRSLMHSHNENEILESINGYSVERKSFELVEILKYE